MIDPVKCKETLGCGDGGLKGGGERRRGKREKKGNNKQKERNS